MIPARKSVLVLATLLLGAVAWLPAAVAWFAAEDLTQLYNVRGKPFGIWSGGDGPGFFRPIISCILWAGQALWGTEPRPFHLLNIMLHLANSVVVYSIARQWLGLLPDKPNLVDRRTMLAFIAAVWFWLWPAHAEPVGWILGITDVGAALPALGSLSVYLHYRKCGKSRWLVVSLLLYAVALACKESVAALPGVIALYEASRWILLGQRHYTRALVPLALFALVALGYVQIRYLATGAYIGGYSTATHTDFSWSRLKGILPWSLSNLFLPLPVTTPAIKTILLVMLVLGIRVALGRRQSTADGSMGSVAMLVCGLALASLIALLPGINLPVGVIMEGQRFAYFASAFSIMCLATATGAVISRRRLLIAFACAVSVVLAALLLNYNIPRYQAGKVARQIVRDMKKLPHARNIYVLTTPGTYRDAFIMPHGFRQAAKMTNAAFATEEVPNLSNIVNWYPGLGVNVSRVAENQYRISLDLSPGHTLKPWIMIYPDAAGEWYTATKDGEDMIVTLHQFNAARDKVAYVDGDEWIVLD